MAFLGEIATPNEGGLTDNGVAQVVVITAFFWVIEFATVIT
jgi:hypothetical protein